MDHLLNDPMFFYSIAFVIFVSLAFKYGRAPLLGWVDGEIAKIRAELDEAKALRAEAEIALADYKLKQTAALSEAEAIIRNAQVEANRLREQAATDLQTAMARQQQQAADRIRLAEAEALTAVRRAAVDLALKMAEEQLAAGLQAGNAGGLTDQALAEIPGLFRRPAQAA